MVTELEIASMTEAEMIAGLCAEVKRRYPHRSRLATPDYRAKQFYPQQWKCLAGVYYWKLSGDLQPILAAFTRRTETYLFDPAGLSPDLVRTLLP